MFCKKLNLFIEQCFHFPKVDVYEVDLENLMKAAEYLQIKGLKKSNEEIVEVHEKRTPGDDNEEISAKKKKRKRILSSQVEEAVLITPDNGTELCPRNEASPSAINAALYNHNYAAKVTRNVLVDGLEVSI